MAQAFVQRLVADGLPALQEVVDAEPPLLSDAVQLITRIAPSLDDGAARTACLIAALCACLYLYVSRRAQLLAGAVLAPLALLHVTMMYERDGIGIAAKYATTSMAALLLKPQFTAAHAVAMVIRAIVSSAGLVIDGVAEITSFLLAAALSVLASRGDHGLGEALPVFIVRTCALLLWTHLTGIPPKSLLVLPLLWVLSVDTSGRNGLLTIIRRFCVLTALCARLLVALLLAFTWYWCGALTQGRFVGLVDLANGVVRGECERAVAAGTVALALTVRTAAAVNPMFFAAHRNSVVSFSNLCDASTTVPRALIGVLLLTTGATKLIMPMVAETAAHQWAGSGIKVLCGQDGATGSKKTYRRNCCVVPRSVAVVSSVIRGAYTLFVALLAVAVVITSWAIPDLTVVTSFVHMYHYGAAAAAATQVPHLQHFTSFVRSVTSYLRVATGMREPAASILVATAQCCKYIVILAPLWRHQQTLTSAPAIDAANQGVVLMDYYYAVKCTDVILGASLVSLGYVALAVGLPSQLQDFVVMLRIFRIACCVGIVVRAGLITYHRYIGTYPADGDKSRALSASTAADMVTTIATNEAHYQQRQLGAMQSEPVLDIHTMSARNSPQAPISQLDRGGNYWPERRVMYPAPAFVGYSVNGSSLVRSVAGNKTGKFIRDHHGAIAKPVKMSDTSEFVQKEMHVAAPRAYAANATQADSPDARGTRYAAPFVSLPPKRSTAACVQNSWSVTSQPGLWGRHAAIKPPNHYDRPSAIKQPTAATQSPEPLADSLFARYTAESGRKRPREGDDELFTSSETRGHHLYHVAEADDDILMAETDLDNCKADHRNISHSAVRARRIRKHVNATGGDDISASLPAIVSDEWLGTALQDITFE